MTQIIVNGHSLDTDAAQLTYEQLVEMAGYQNDRLWTVTVNYRPENDKRGRVPEPGWPVIVRAGMIVNVADTSRV